MGLWGVDWGSVVHTLTTPPMVYVFVAGVILSGALYLALGGGAHFAHSARYALLGSPFSIALFALLVFGLVRSLGLLIVQAENWTVLGLSQDDTSLYAAVGLAILVFLISLWMLVRHRSRLRYTPPQRRQA